MYQMMKQEMQLQKEEEKYIYMSTFGHEGDDSDLETVTESEGQALSIPRLKIQFQRLFCCQRQ